MANLTLPELAQQIRRDIITISHRAHIGHVGSALSVVEILTLLYHQVLHINPKNPKWKNRDLFILSKGHAAAALYAVLHQTGFISDAQLKTFCQDNSLLLVHPEFSELAGIDATTGSLGHGFPLAVGMAYGLQVQKRSERVYVLISDSELNEGTIWESALFAGHHKLHNLTVIIDYNHSQGLGPTNNIIRLEPLKEKWEAFGFKTEMVNGHDFSSLRKAFSRESNKPKCLIAETIIGKGVSFMEGDFHWHYYDPKDEHVDQAIKELSK